MNDNIEEAARILKNSLHTTAFTGAGISVESGIPPFRGPEGLWSKYDPVILDIHFFQTEPEKSWKAIIEIFYDFFGKTEPNEGHKALAMLEEKAFIKSIITQNIDNLHQEAGSRDVIEYHGNYKKLICTDCHSTYNSEDFDLKKALPRCKNDNNVLKPDFVFFGEAIPQKAADTSLYEVSIADVFLLVGTTGEIMPANMIPRMAKENGATIIEVNTEESLYTHEITDIFLKGKAGEILPSLAELIL